MASSLWHVGNIPPQDAQKVCQQGRIQQTQNDEHGTLKWEGFLCSSFIAHRSAFPTLVDFFSILLVKQRSSV